MLRFQGLGFKRPGSVDPRAIQLRLLGFVFRFYGFVI